VPKESLVWTVVLRNGLLLIVPAMVITFALWPRLPAAYGGDAFNRGVPGWLIAAENGLRLGAIALPLFLYFGGESRLQVAGWYMYVTGLVLYLGSYVALIYFPASAWGSSIVGFTAPAWTTLFWFVGISLVCASTWLPWTWHRAVYLVLAISFVVAHVAHACVVFLRDPLV